LTTATQTTASGLTRSALSDGSFGVRVRVSRAASASAPNFTASLDAVHVVVTWTSPTVDHGVTLGGFDLSSVPSGSVVTQIKTEARWRTSVSSNRADLAFRLFSDGVALGAEYVDGSVPTSLTIRTQTLTGLALSPAELGDLTVKVRASREAGSSNPDFVAHLDYVRVTVTYVETVDDAVSECNASNNWTATKLNPSPDACQDMSTPEYTPFEVTRVFQSVCPMGQKPTWRRFGYTTSTPGDTSVEFRFRSFAASSDGTCTALPAVTGDMTDDPEPLATASASADPEICLTTDATCVKDFSQGTGALANPGLECLQMDAYGIPSETESPQLFDWTVLYDCRDAE
jgi:hypothetical protein